MIDSDYNIKKALVALAIEKTLFEWGLLYYKKLAIGYLKNITVTYQIATRNPSI